MFTAKTHPLLDVYAMLWHVVRAFPAVADGAGLELTGKRPQTFAALSDINDIEADTLKKDGRYADPAKHLFYSRAWHHQSGNPSQTSTLKFNYPLVAVQPTAIVPLVKDPYTTLRISLAVFDQHPLGAEATSRGSAYAASRTFEELEADLNNILENALREWLGKWAAYRGDGGAITWSPTCVAGQQVAWKMRDAITQDGFEAQFYSDAGVDKVAALQANVTLKMPALSCYQPASLGGPVAFDYGQSTDPPRSPDQRP